MKYKFIKCLWQSYDKPFPDFISNIHDFSVLNSSDQSAHHFYNLVTACVQVNNLIWTITFESSAFTRDKCLRISGRKIEENKPKYKR